MSMKLIVILSRKEDVWSVLLFLHERMRRDYVIYGMIDEVKSSWSCWRLRLSGLHLDMQVFFASSEVEKRTAQ